MTARRPRRVAGLLALALGVVFFVVFPTLGLAEALAGVGLLAAHRPTERALALVAIVPTILILVFAMLTIVTSSTTDRRIGVVLALWAGLTTVAMLRAAFATKSPGLQLP